MRTVHALLHDILHSSCDFLQRIVIRGAKNIQIPRVPWSPPPLLGRCISSVDARDACAWNGCTHCVLLTKSMGRQAELHRGHRASARGPSAATRRRFGAALLLFLGRQARPLFHPQTSNRRIGVCIALLPSSLRDANDLRLCRVPGGEGSDGPVANAQIFPTFSHRIQPNKLPAMTRRKQVPLSVFSIFLF
jgi:hypothetical protein